MSTRTESTTSANLPHFASPPSTPNLRNRSSLLTHDITTSPTSTTISDSGVSAGFRQTAETLPPHTSAGFAAQRKITIRSDPALLTCFDAADKQLYDLWVSKA